LKWGLRDVAWPAKKRKTKGGGGSSVILAKKKRNAESRKFVPEGQKKRPKKTAQNRRLNRSKAKNNLGGEAPGNGGEG